MTYLFSGEPQARHRSTCTEAAPHFQDAAQLGISPQTGDYLIGDKAGNFHTLRLLAIGSLYAVNNCRDSLHALGYAHPSEWSHPIPLAGNSGILRGLTPHDVMRILTKRIPLPG